MKKIFALHITLILFSFPSWNQQNKATVKGKVADEIQQNFGGILIQIEETKETTRTDANGNYSILVNANERLTLKVTSAQYKDYRIRIRLSENEVKTINPVLYFKFRAQEVTAEKDNPIMTEQIDKIYRLGIPTPSGNVEDVIKTAGLGANSNNELTSGYNVRGGNFDENLIYVNDIEVYRPFLARSGLQEGLSFTNSSMVENLKFSGGGFESKYGDKLSSVLDIKYRIPKDTLEGSVEASLLGAGITLGGATTRFSHLTGFRYRTNQYLFGALDTRGEYKPSFYDIQSYLNYDVTEKFQIGFFGSYSSNKYTVIPQTRETNFGSINEALRLTVYFAGQELTQYQTGMGAITATFKPNDSTSLKLISSMYSTQESESFDIEGQYFIDELETDLGSENLGDVKANLGIGGFLDHARNELYANIFNIYHKGETEYRNSTLNWGVKYQHEHIEDVYKEWETIDSAGYSIPHVSDSVGYTDPNAQPYQNLELLRSIKAKNEVNSNRFSGYFQNTFRLGKFKRISKIHEVTLYDTIKKSDTTILLDTNFNSYAVFSINAGVRANYWSYNNELVVSPRISLEVKPRFYYSKNNLFLRRNITFRFATGYYYQPPFYREYRDFDGNLNPNIQSQKSIHFVFGTDYVFSMWNRPFKFTGEVYYKYLDNVIPYEIDNVRIRYYAENNAKAYAYGFDTKINGEFINGVESWARFSYLKVEEDIIDDYYYDYFNADGEKIIAGFTQNNEVVDSVIQYPGYIPRPSDQRMTLALFFQDKMPSKWNTDKVKWDSYKVNVNMIFGTSLPYGPPSLVRYKDTLRTPFYRRLDIGFVKEFLTNKESLPVNSFWQNFESISLALEVFNLLGVQNTVSYQWIRAANDRQYAIPNFLTSRRLNLKLTVRF